MYTPNLTLVKPTLCIERNRANEIVTNSNNVDKFATKKKKITISKFVFTVETQ